MGWPEKLEMASENELPDESRDDSDGDESSDDECEMSPREQIELNREINALEQEGEHLTACQKYLRLNQGWEEDAAEELHGDLVEFLQQQSIEQDAIGLSEVAVALWDELARIEMSLQNGESTSNTTSEEQDGSTESDTPSNPAHQTTIDSDPMFQ